MEILGPGECLQAKVLAIPEASESREVEVVEGVGETPHGYTYRARVGETPVELTVVARSRLNDPATLKLLEEDLPAGGRIRHRNLSRMLGHGECADGLFIVRQSVKGRLTLREFINRRLSKGKSITISTAIKVSAQICDALEACAEVGPHGYICADTVYVDREGHVLVSGYCEGRILPRATGFARFVGAGLIPRAVQDPRDPSPADDIYAVSALMVEMLAGRAVEAPGIRLDNVTPSPALNMVLEQMLSRDATARGAKLADFRRQLVAAGRARTVDRIEPPPQPQGGWSMQTGSHPVGPGASGSWAAPMNMPGAPPPPMGGPGPMGPGPFGGPGTGPHPMAPAPGGSPFGPPGAPPPPPGPPLGPPSALGTGPHPSAPPPPPPGGSPFGPPGRQHAPQEELADRHKQLEPDAVPDLQIDLSKLEGDMELGSLDGRDQETVRVDGEGGAHFESADEPEEEATGDNLEEILERQRHDQERRCFLISRDGVDHGPFNLKDLLKMVESDRLYNTDRIRFRTQDKEHPLMAVDHPVLRDAFEARLEAARKAEEAAQKKAEAAELAKEDAPPSMAGTLVRVVMAIAVLGAIAWVLYQRSGGG